MPRSLPAAEVVRKFIDESFDPASPVMVLRWPGGEGLAERLWELPEGLTIAGQAPSRFGWRIRRTGPDSYAVRLVWDRTVLAWQHLPRLELLGCCIGSILAALGVQLWSVLEQPVVGPSRLPRAA
jgi:hypothetical protein